MELLSGEDLGTINCSSFSPWYHWDCKRMTSLPELPSLSKLSTGICVFFCKEEGLIQENPAAGDNTVCLVQIYTLPHFIMFWSSFIAHWLQRVLNISQAKAEQYMFSLANVPFKCSGYADRKSVNFPKVPFISEVEYDLDKAKPGLPVVLLSRQWKHY